MSPLLRARPKRRDAGRVRRIATCLTAVFVALFPSAAALASGAAPTYVTSDPQNGSTVQEGPSRVSVTFSEPLDSGSTLQVFDECGRAIDANDEQVLGSRIDVGLALIPSGKYTAVYVARGFGGATGETKGSFSFNVTSGVPCDGGHHHHGTHGGGDDDGHEGGHEGHGGGHGGGSGHSGHGGGSGESHHAGSGTDHAAHEGAGHDAAGHGASGHHGGSEGHAGGHGGGAHHDGRGTHSETHNGDGNGGLDELASGRGGLGLAPTSTSVMIALALSIAMGALGGWVLRVSAGS